jgi:hypothetical protein
VGTLNNRSRITKGVRRTWLTLFRSNRARTDGNNDGHSNRGLREHCGSPSLKFVHTFPVWETLRQRYQEKCEMVHNRKLF